MHSHKWVVQVAVESYMSKSDLVYFPEMVYHIFRYVASQVVPFTLPLSLLAALPPLVSQSKNNSQQLSRTSFIVPWKILYLLLSVNVCHWEKVNQTVS